MATGLTTRQREQTRSTPPYQAPVSKPERRLPYLVLGLILSIASYFVYGGRDDTAEIIRQSHSIHIQQRDSMLSGSDYILVR